jgi:hypothetical protein
VIKCLCRTALGAAILACSPPVNAQTAAEPIPVPIAADQPGPMQRIAPAPYSRPARGPAQLRNAKMGSMQAAFAIAGVVGLAGAAVALIVCFIGTKSKAAA